MQIFLILFISTGFLLSLGKKSLVFASDGITNPAIGALGNDIAKAKSGALLLEQFVRLWANAMTIGAIMVIGYFLWGAVEWITSGGDTGKLDKARQKMTHAAIGMIILVSSFIIIGFISSLLFGDNFDLLNLKFFTPGT